MSEPPFFPDGPPPWPVADPDIKAALELALQEGEWGRYTGRPVLELTNHLRNYLDSEHVFLCASGTWAVEVALRAIGVCPGDEVVCSAYDYPDNFLTVHALGAMPVLVDITPQGGLDLRMVASAVTSKTKAVLVSHLHGARTSIQAVRELTGLRIVEDAAQAAGAEVDGRRAGSVGDVGIWSFGGSKLLSASRGGAVFTRDAALAQRIRLALQRGQQCLAPLSTLQAAVLLPQLVRLDERTARRAQAVSYLRGRLANSGLEFWGDELLGLSAYYKLGIWLPPGVERASYCSRVRAAGVALDPAFPAAHVGRSPRRYRAVGDLPHASAAHSRLTVLHHPVLLGNGAQLDRLAEVLLYYRA